MSLAATLLYVDRSAPASGTFVRRLAAEGYAVRRLESVDRALSLVGMLRFDVILVGSGLGAEDHARMEEARVTGALGDASVCFLGSPPSAQQAGDFSSALNRWIREQRLLRPESVRAG